MGLLLASANLDIGLPDAVDGTGLFEFLFVVDTLDRLGVQGERTLGNQGGKKNDTGADTELNACDLLQAAHNVSVGSPVLVDDGSENGTQDGVEDDVRGVQECHHSTKGRDVGVLGGIITSAEGGLNIGGQRNIASGPAVGNRNEGSGDPPSPGDIVRDNGAVVWQDPNDVESESIETEPRHGSGAAKGI